MVINAAQKSQHLDIYNNIRIVVRECDSRLSRSASHPRLLNMVEAEEEEG